MLKQDHLHAKTLFAEHQYPKLLLMIHRCAERLRTFSEEPAIHVNCLDHNYHWDQRLVKKITGFKGEILTDTTKPDGTPRKLMDVSKLADIGWRSSITLEEGIGKVYNEVKEYNWT